MARRGRRSERGTVDTANPLLERRNALSSVDELLRAYEALDTSLMEVEDGRQWHPLRQDRPAESFRRADRMFTDSVVAFDDRRPSRGFAHPPGVAVCIRRKTRREVLHALRKTGRGGSKKRRYNWKSFVKC